MKNIIALIISVFMGVSGTGATVEPVETVENSVLSVIVDRLEDNDYVVTEVCYGDYYNIIDIKQEDFNTYKNEGDRINAIAIDGKFHCSGEWYKGEDFSIAETYYQFKSNDDTVWWALTVEDIGFIPEENTEYTLIYFDNDTTVENKNCDCKPEWECECEVYDDIFLGIVKK